MFNDVFKSFSPGQFGDLGGKTAIELPHDDEINWYLELNHVNDMDIKKNGRKAIASI